MKRNYGRVYLPGVLIIFCLLLLVVDASAQGTLKTQLNISGTAADSVGNPIDGAKAYRVRFYDAADAGLQIGTDLIGSVTLSSGGVFNIPIDPPAEVATQSDVWYELALDTDDDGLDADDVFPERVAIHGVPFAHNADLLDGENSNYYLNTANMIGTVPSSALNLTDSDIPDDITIQLAAEALSATQAASATNTLLLEGQPGSYYLDAANLTGTVPSDRLSLTDSDVPDDITISEAQLAIHAVSATNALLLESQPGSYYLDSGNLTGTISSARLSLIDSDVPEGLTISGGTINNSPIGSATPASGVFTELISSGTPQFEGGSIILGKAGAANRGEVLLHDATDATDYLVRLLAPSSLVSDVTWTLPISDGTANQVLVTDGAGNLSFSTVQVPLPGSTIEIGNGASGSLNGVAVGVQANGINYGNAVGYQTKANSYGSALGYQANAESYGTAVGYRANGYDQNVVIGYRANAYTGTGAYSGSVSVGYLSNSYSGNGNYSGSVAIGYSANARHNFNEHTAGAVAIGRRANAFIRGVAIGGSTVNYSAWEPSSPSNDGHLGNTATGYNEGVGVGYAAGGQNQGVGIGYRANGYSYGTAIGYRANSGNKGQSFAKGSYSRVTRYNEEWKGADTISVSSDNQLNGLNKYGYGQVDWYGSSYNATLTELFLGGKDGERFVLQDNSVVTFRIYVSALDIYNGLSSGWEHFGVVRRKSGSQTTVVTGYSTNARTDGALNTAPILITSDGALAIKVTGVSGTMVKWNAMMIYSEVRQ